jgi:hypothetical protein
MEQSLGLPETEIREVPIRPNRKKPTGWVAHHRVRDSNRVLIHDWSTGIMVDEVDYNHPKRIINLGYDRAKTALNNHLATCDLSITNRTRSTRSSPLDPG